MGDKNLEKIFVFLGKSSDPIEAHAIMMGMIDKGIRAKREARRPLLNASEVHKTEGAKTQRFPMEGVLVHCVQSSAALREEIDSTRHKPPIDFRIFSPET
jgi:hypothetical protein